MLEEQLDILKIYMKENGLLRSECSTTSAIYKLFGAKS